MAKCPNCGVDAANSIKSWSMVGKPSKIGEIFKLTMGLYECGSCGKSFRNVEAKEKTTIKEVLDKNETLEEKLMEASKRKLELEEKVQALEMEKACLLGEVEALRLIPMLEQKASSLEDDIKTLHGEKEALIHRVEELTSAGGAEVAPTLFEKKLESYIAKPASAIPDVSVEGSSTELPVIEASSAVLPIKTECKCKSLTSEGQGEVISAVLSVPDVPVDVVSPEAVTVEAPMPESAIIEPASTGVSISEEKCEEVVAPSTSPVEVPPTEVSAIDVNKAEFIPASGISAPVVQVEAPMPEAVPPEAHLDENVRVEEKPIEATSTQLSPEADLTVPTSQIESVASAVIEEIKTEAIPVDTVAFNVIPGLKPNEEVQGEATKVEETHVETPTVEGTAEVSTSVDSVTQPSVVEVTPPATVDEAKTEIPSIDQSQIGAVTSNPNIIDASTILNSITEKIHTDEILTGETSKVLTPEKKLDETPATGATL